ncbi:MAG: T9SS type A sorting domain-containing protein [Bacteroidales bacterium]|jgi:hypothetical protein|nr:T9SS type A sorting domain-containing protein [Bacteroidales bacterium]
MKKVFILLVATLFLLPAVSSQDLIWSHSTNDNDLEMGIFVNSDSQNKVYVGAAGTGRMYLIKYTDMGMAEFMAGDNHANDFNSMALSDDGTAYMVGVKEQLTGHKDGLIHAYDTQGNPVFTQTYDYMNEDDLFQHVTLDNAGNSYVVGQARDVIDHYALTVKYSSTGSVEWIQRYGTTLDAYLASLAGTMGNGDICVAGGVYINATGDTEIFLLRYDTDGNLLQDTIIDFPGYKIAMPSFMLIDEQDNLYIGGVLSTGPTLYKGFLIRLTDGEVVWEEIVESPYQYAVFVNGSLDNDGNILVCGIFWNSNQDAYYAKFSPSGTLLYQKYINGPGNGDDSFSKIISRDEYAYICGQSTGIGTGYDYYIMKVDEAGEKEWDARYNGFGNGDDHAFDICLDEEDNVIVTGSSDEGGVMHCTTLKYTNSLGINERPEAIQAIDLHRNPVEDVLQFTYPISSASAKYNITDMLGKKVASGKLAAGEVHAINLNSIKSGSYVLQVRENRTMGQARFIVR